MTKTKEPSIHQKKAEYRFLDKFLSKVKNLDTPVYQEMIKLKDQLGEETGLGLSLEEKIRRFLIKYDLPLYAVPKIDELNKYKGGPSLVREIAVNGGIKKIRISYAEWYSINGTSVEIKQFFLKHDIPLWDEEELIA